MNSTVIRFPPLVDLRAKQPLDYAAIDREWEAKFQAGVRRRLAAKVRDLPVPAFLKRQCG